MSDHGISTQILTNIWSGTGICIIHRTISLLTASRALCFQEPINRLFIDKHALIEKANVGRQEPEGEFSFALLPPLPSPTSFERASERRSREKSGESSACFEPNWFMGHEEIFKILDVARLNWR